MTLVVEEFRQAVASLHRRKSAAYRDAWKKRGEILSIVANIARKVDRIEYMLDDTASVPDETILDTAIDLFVYCLKYETFLLELDSSRAKELLGNPDLAKPYSEGTRAFEDLLRNTDLGALQTRGLMIDESARQVVRKFNELESCFAGLNMNESVDVRLTHVEALTQAAVKLIGSIAGDQGASYQQFVDQQRAN